MRCGYRIRVRRRGADHTHFGIMLYTARGTMMIICACHMVHNNRVVSKNNGNFQSQVVDLNFKLWVDGICALYYKKPFESALLKAQGSGSLDDDKLDPDHRVMMFPERPSEKNGVAPI